jgi:hypothetical protein
LLCRYTRLYDTRSAGGYLPQQQGDFIVAAATGGWLIECKASRKHNSLKSCLADNVEQHQAANLRLWHRFQPAIVLFCAAGDGNRIEVWDGETIGHARAEGERLRRDQCLKYLDWSEFPDWLFQQFTGDQQCR